MSLKTTALAVLCASASLAVAAQAAPVTVALYAFSSQSDVLAFTRQSGAKCKKKWAQNKQMAITVGRGTSRCVFRSSVVGDSTDPGSDMEVSATGFLGASTPKKLQKKAFIAVGARVSETAGYELRVRPHARSWQLFRDARGTATGPELFRSGKGKFIRKASKPNGLLLRAFDWGGETTSLLAQINGKTVALATDAGNSQPDGRRSVVSTGVKGAGAGLRVIGAFDTVAIKVPNPFG